MSTYLNPLLAALLSLTLIACTQDISEPVPQDPQLDPVFKEWDTSDAPGMSVAVVRDGQLIYSKGFGLAQMEYGIPITTDTIFHVASVSKQFTAMAVTLLADDGVLSLDDEVQKHLPWVPRFDAPTTLRQLINHTSGIRDQWELWNMAGGRFDDVISMEDIRHLMENQRELNFPPQSEFLYSNMGYTLLADTVSAVSGMSFEEFTLERIFKPLSMNNTHFHIDHEEIVPNRAYSYQQDAEGQLKKSVLSYANVGATSLFTTPEDLTRWLDNFRSLIVGNEAVMEEMRKIPVLTADKPATPAEEGAGYAGGISVGKYRGLEYISHGGSDAGFRAHVVFYPQHDLGIAITANFAEAEPSKLTQQVADMLLANEFPETAKEQSPDRLEVAVDRAQLEKYVGYFGLDMGIVMEFTIRNGKLQPVVPGIEGLKLTALSDYEFFLEGLGVTMQFVEDDDGTINKVLLEAPGQPAASGTRLQPIILSPEELARFQGRYYSPELDFAVQLEQDEKGLVIDHSRHGDIRLVGLDAETPGTMPADVMGSLWFFGATQFETEDRGNVTGMRVSGMRVRNLLFNKAD